MIYFLQLLPLLNRLNPCNLQDLLYCLGRILESEKLGILDKLPFIAIAEIMFLLSINNELIKLIKAWVNTPANVKKYPGNG